MGKLGDVRGNVALTIDNLAGIRGDLVRNDDEWQNWDFVNFVMHWAPGYVEISRIK